jgi:recombinational DNA repair protein RecT
VVKETDREIAHKMKTNEEMQGREETKYMTKRQVSEWKKRTSWGRRSNNDGRDGGVWKESRRSRGRAKYAKQREPGTIGE